MPTKGKPSSKIEFNTFVQGLITEASPLNFPANASFDEENFELNRTGTRFRRKGMDFEDSSIPVLSAVGMDVIQDNPPSTFKWLNVGGVATKNLLVVQVGRELKMFDMAVEPITSVLVVTIPLTFDSRTRYSFANVDGRLIVAGGADTVAIISYLGILDGFPLGLFNTDYRRLLTRDVWGVEETIEPAYETDVSYRGSVNDQHRYNLQNQSWGIPRKNKEGILSDPVTMYSTDFPKFPSNSEVVWTGLQFQPVEAGKPPYERVFTNLYEETLGGELHTAKGYFIIDVLRRGNSRTEQFANNKVKYPKLTVSAVELAEDLTQAGASVITEFAGRVWYGGFDGRVVGGDRRSPNLSNLVFFSQLIKSVPDIVKCYQAGDPTSRESSDVVDTDGGFVRVAGMGKLVAMLNLSTSLILIADNGVWSVTGGNDFGFTATNYKVDKISTFGGIASASVIDFAGKAMYWGEDGIYLIGKDQYGVLIVNSATETSIQTFYEAIDNTIKATAIGCYDALGKKIRWLYKSGDMFSSVSVQRELVFDLVLNAFSKNQIFNATDNSVEVVSVFSAVEFRNSTGNENVLLGSDPVQVSTDNVQVPDNSLLPALQATRYLSMRLISGLLHLDFSYYKNEEYKDWGSTAGGGVDAKAYLITGAITGGDSSVSKQVPYLTFHFYRTEDGVDSNLVPVNQSGCLFRAQWDFSNSINSNKWSPLREGYRYTRQYLAASTADLYDTGFSIITTKNKLRGRGRAFSMYLETVPLKDCKIVGWNLSIDGNSN